MRDCASTISTLPNEIVTHTLRRNLAMRSRQRFDPLATSTNPYWLVVTDLYRNPLTVTPLAPGTNLHAALRAGIDGYVADGWHAEGDGAFGFVFIARGVER